MIITPAEHRTCRAVTENSDDANSSYLQLPACRYFCLSCWRCRMKKAEKIHLSRVAALGCIVCRNLQLGESPAEIHHVRSGQGAGQRADHFHAIPLCPLHHRQGGHGVAVHAGRKTWEKNHGSELGLLAQVNAELGVVCSNQ